ncbi:radical SAM protein [Breoghania sp.]|uniref:radical SAM protein n=1 Tax=Breoghania sp. TaxID=2065378 RepID=UPI0029CAA19F|nr:radical SAM protein [Breoghania sp.]
MFLLRSTVNELSDQAYWEAASEAFSTDRLELTLLPTEQCNLRCGYCYEKFEHGRMQPAVVSGVKSLIDRRAEELRHLSIDWFGGEPLLASDIMIEIGSHAQSVAAQSDILYLGSATTNGILLDARNARALTDVGIRRFHVSLDGPKQSHDLTRKAAGGRGTFDKLMGNLREIKASDIAIKIELRVHVTPANVDVLPDFADFLRQEFLSDPRFSAYFFPIVDLGGPNQGDFGVLTYERARVIVDELTARLWGRDRVRPKIEAKTCDSCYVCYAAKGNAWVIRSTGQIVKCTVGLDDPLNHVGTLHADGTMEIIPRKSDIWLRGWQSKRQIDLHCPYENMREDVQSGQVEARA